MSSPETALSTARTAVNSLVLRPTLRFLTCGSVHDGKSTLIGRLLYEQKLVFDDDLDALKLDSKKRGTSDADIDFALLLDRLDVEREQGITIDVAYRSFATAQRAFVVADTPGHEQYTRNVAIGASNCDVAVLLVDARKGLLKQTRRHAIIVSMFGIRRAVLAVNKIDLMDYSKVRFEAIVREFSDFAAALGFKELRAIPLSARYGDNVATHSERTPWYKGPHLLEYLETIDVEDERASRAFRLPVQRVNRSNLDFAGTIASGRIRVGDEIAVQPSGQMSRIKSILGMGGEANWAAAGDAVTVCLEHEIDVARGDMLGAAHEPPQVADQFAAHLVWMSREPLLPGRSYFMKINHATLPATITDLKHRVDTESLAKCAAKTLELNEIGVCNLSTGRPIAFDSYANNRTTGAFTLIDRISNETVAAGIVDFALRRATNIRQEPLLVTKTERSRLMNQQPAVLWFTGLSGAGKSTIANLVETRLHARGVHTLLLDGDNVRHGLNKDLGFTEADRVENIRRIGEVTKLMTDAGLVVLCAFISPFRIERQMVRELMASGEFIEIFVDTPLEQCIARDPKGLYQRALKGEIKNFTGVDQVYEAPERPELHLMAAESSAAMLADQVIDELVRREMFRH